MKNKLKIGDKVLSRNSSTFKFDLNFPETFDGTWFPLTKEQERDKWRELVFSTYAVMFPEDVVGLILAGNGIGDFKISWRVSGLVSIVRYESSKDLVLLDRSKI